MMVAAKLINQSSLTPLIPIDTKVDYPKIKPKEIKLKTIKLVLVMLFSIAIASCGGGGGGGTTTTQTLSGTAAQGAPIASATTLMLSAGSVVAESGNTKIAPTEAAPPHPFTIIDTPDGRLVDGSVAVFKFNGAETILPLNTHKPYKTAQGAIPAGMGGGIYEVFVRLPGGTEFFVGTFTVIAPAIITEPPSISPTSGSPGTPFTLYDPQGRMATAQLVVFTPFGQSFDNGALVIGPVFSADGTTVSGRVPATAEPAPSLVTVHQVSQLDPPLFNGLAYTVY